MQNVGNSGKNNMLSYICSTEYEQLSFDYEYQHKIPTMNQ